MKKLGRRHRPFFRVCVVDSRKPRDGKTIEEVGTYDPMVREKKNRVTLNMERIDYWISVGAQPSDNVATLIKKVKTDTFGSASAPPPMTAPKAPPEPVEEPMAEEAVEEESKEAAASEETKAKESKTEEGSEKKTPTEESAPAETTEETPKDSAGEKS